MNTSLPTRAVRVAALSFALVAVGGAQAATILVDFGNNPTTGPVTPTGSISSVYYNNVSGGGVTNLNLVDSTNVSTGYTLTAGGFNAGAQGSTSPDLSLGLFAVGSVMQDYAYVDIGTRYSFTLSNLDTSLVYSFAFTASRAGANNRDTIYRAAGTTTVESPTFSTISNNTTDFVSIGGITAAGSGNNGTITLSFISGPGNNTFSYLGALQINTVAAVPEPSAYPAIAGAAVLGMAALRRRRRIAA